MHRSRGAAIALRVIVVIVTAGLLVRAFAGVDWRATLRVVSNAGPLVVVALVPFGVGLLLDTSGVLLVARAAGIELRATTTLGVRVVSEAFHFGAPGGVVAGEAAAIAMFDRWAGLPLHESVVVLAGRKLLVMRAHAAYLVFAALCGTAALASLGSLLGARAPISWLVLGSAAVPLAMSVLLALAMRRAPRFERARPYTARLAKAQKLTVPATLVFLAAWLVEAAETAVILRLAGAPLSMPAVLAVEGTLSLARSAVAFVPGGLGVQDIGYSAVLVALGVPREHAAAFVLLKRMKEVAWIALGFATHLCMLIARAQRSQTTPTREVPREATV